MLLPQPATPRALFLELFLAPTLTLRRTDTTADEREQQIDRTPSYHTTYGRKYKYRWIISINVSTVLTIPFRAVPPWSEL